MALRTLTHALRRNPAEDGTILRQRPPRELFVVVEQTCCRPRQLRLQACRQQRRTQARAKSQYLLLVELIRQLGILCSAPAAGYQASTRCQYCLA